MSKLDIVRNIVDEAYICNRGFLEERQPQFVMRIDFDDRDLDDRLVFRFDNGGIELFPYFKKEEPSLKKLCDYFILFEKKNKLYVLICELKKGTSNKASANKQLRAGEIFIEFLIKTAERLDYNLVLEDVVFYKLRFIEKSILKFNKRTTKCGNVLHGCTDGIYEYRSEKIRLIDFK